VHLYLLHAFSAGRMRKLAENLDKNPLHPRQFSDLWCQFDPKNRQLLHVTQLIHFLRTLGSPLGICPNQGSRAELKFLLKLEVPVQQQAMDGLFVPAVSCLVLWKHLLAMHLDMNLSVRAKKGKLFFEEALFDSQKALHALQKTLEQQVSDLPYGYVVRASPALGLSEKSGKGRRVKGLGSSERKPSLVELNGPKGKGTRLGVGREDDDAPFNEYFAATLVQRLRAALAFRLHCYWWNRNQVGWCCRSNERLERGRRSSEMH
jgi:hypothetical protein